VIVVDASVLTLALTDDDRTGAAARAELARDPGWAAPEHLLVEVFSAVRGRHLGGRISRRRAEDALAALGEVTLEVVATSSLLPRMWELRSNVSGHDAAYVALAEVFGCPLVTADARLARAVGPRCEIRLVGPGH